MFILCALAHESSWADEVAPTISQHDVHVMENKAYFDSVRECWARYPISELGGSKGIIEEVAFRVPCVELLTREFINSLQRALAARGYYNASITGRLDPTTAEAVKAFQRARGFDSPILTLDTTQFLGLSPKNH